MPNTHDVFTGSIVSDITITFCCLVDKDTNFSIEHEHHTIHTVSNLYEKHSIYADVKS